MLNEPYTELSESSTRTPASSRALPHVLGRGLVGLARHHEVERAAEARQRARADVPVAEVAGDEHGAAAARRWRALDRVVGRLVDADRLRRAD